MRRLTILLFFVIHIYPSLGQDKVILTSGEELEGKISIDLPSTGFESIVIKVGKGKTKLKAHEFISFTQKDDLYVPIKLGAYYRIMKEKISGYLSLYSFREDGAYEFGSQYLHKKDNQGMYVPNFGFKKQVSAFLEDCVLIEENFENGEYKKNDLEQIVKDYNSCIDKNTLQSKLNVEEVNDTTNPSIALIDGIKRKLGDTNSELTTLLTDIQTKLAQGKSVPGYLKSALQDQTRDIKEIQEEISKLLSSI